MTQTRKEALIELRDNYFWLPQKDALSANGTVQTFRDRWWICHPETGDLLFVHVGLRPGRKPAIKEASPQCNGDEGTARFIKDRSYPWANLVFVPLVLKPVDPRDYT